jgi:hypothetical protein
MTNKIKVNLVLTPANDSLPCKVTINDEVILNQELESIQTIVGEVDQSKTLDIKIESIS